MNLILRRETLLKLKVKDRLFVGEFENEKIDGRVIIDNAFIFVYFVKQLYIMWRMFDLKKKKEKNREYY